ncbi:MAG: hypothetical protein OXN89_19005 [Bryobacterales bacterium]|nr:hypothetical protein [Bryobacterales bacterium]
MADTPPPQPDSKRLFDLLQKIGMDAGDAYTFIQEVGNMAAANLIARFESKLEAQNSKLEAQNSKLEAQNSKIDAQSAQFASIRWIMGIGFTLLALLITLLRFLG